MQTTRMGRIRALTFYQKTALFCIPGFVLFALFWIYPFGITVYYSFVESAFRHTFAGLKNYAFVWNNAYYRSAFGNSLRFCLAAVPAACPVTAQHGMTRMMSHIASFTIKRVESSTRVSR